jgi:hypothetical protein
MDDSGPVEIIPPDGAEVTRLTYRYANGVVMYHGGGLGEAAVDFVGTEGRVAVNRGSFLLTEPTTLRHEHIGPLETRLYESSNHMANWLDCIRTRRAPICPAEIGCRSVSVCHLGNLAYWLKRPLKWDPVAERFLDDPEANRLIHRPTRAPWSV